MSTKKPPPPEPTGRCDVDLASLNQFSNVGNGATAKTIDDPSQLVGGNYAQGRLGDFILENDRVRVVVQQVTHAIAPIPYGG